MRCPKCHYLSFDPEPRCKNCGYDLEVADSDLALRSHEPINDADEPRVRDLPLRGADADVVSPQWEPEPEPEWDPAADAAHEAAGAPRLSLLQPAPKRERPKRAPRKAAAGTAVAERPTRPQRIPRAPETFPVDPPSAPEFDEGPAACGEEPAARLVEAAVPVVDLPALMLMNEKPAPARAEAEVEAEPAFRTPFRAAHTTADLPLFVKAIADNEALADDDDDLRQPAAPVRFPPAGPPLAVRRAAPEPIRSRPQVPERRTGSLDHDLLEDVKRLEREQREAREDAELTRIDSVVAARHAIDTDDRVEPLHRIAAAAIDVGVLGGLATFVFWATLRLCNVSISALGVSSLAPLLMFLVMMDVGYLLMFTAAGGQTVGKMLMHIRVVDSDATEGERVSVRRAASRAILTVVSLGLGWLPALFGRGTLHDRLAHTRVVRA